MKKIILSLLILLNACASRDPLEPFNRAVWNFNQTTDHYLIIPIAKAYDRITPDPIDQGITHFFNNLENVNIAISDLLQLKIESAINDIGRFAVNTSLGLLGFIDVASRLDVPQHEEDLGQALGYWGAPSGPYLILPILGPSDFRDGLGLWGDILVNPVNRRIQQPSITWSTYGLWYLDQRSDQLDQQKIIQSATFDPYTYVRDAYLQRREFLIRDGQLVEKEDFLDALIEE